MSVEMIERPNPGMGAMQSPPDERDYLASALFAAMGIKAPEAAALPASFIVANRPPILNQGNTPMCVAYSTSSMKSYQDRDDQAPTKWWNFDEPTFFRAIGGGPQGAYLRTAMDRMLKVGYPVVSTTPHPESHKIKAYFAVAKDILAIKQAIFSLGEIVLATPWYNSWFRPDANGMLPKADYTVGGHAIVADGWDDHYGLRLRNSWGSAWGLSGDCFMPYAYVLHAVWEFWKAQDQ